MVYKLFRVGNRKLRAVQPLKQEHEAVLKYWQEVVGRYVKAKREESGKSQEEVLGKPRRTTISELERGAVNFQLDTLLKVLDSIDGDISEAFMAKTPREFQNSRQRQLHDLLAELIESGDETGLLVVQSALETAQRLARRRQLG